jgi:hypothetical protein
VSQRTRQEPPSVALKILLSLAQKMAAGPIASHKARKLEIEGKARKWWNNGLLGASSVEGMRLPSARFRHLLVGLRSFRNSGLVRGLPSGVFCNGSGSFPLMLSRYLPQVL